jgi:hypothetical protein
MARVIIHAFNTMEVHDGKVREEKGEERDSE